jgi:hypothetical protein
VHSDIKPLCVDLCEVTITDAATGESIYRDAWATDHLLTEPTLHAFVVATHTRWGSENENNNVLLRNYGYHLEHNYGHDERYLALVLLAFLFRTARICAMNSTAGCERNSPSAQASSVMYKRCPAISILTVGRCSSTSCLHSSNLTLTHLHRRGTMPDAANLGCYPGFVERLVARADAAGRWRFTEVPMHGSSA